MSYLIDFVKNKGDEDVYYQGILKVSIPFKLAKDLNFKCKCGYFLKANYKLTDTYCPNPYCIESNVWKVIRVFDKAHISLNLGYETLKKILAFNNFSRHMDIFTISSINQFPAGNSDEVKQKWLDGLSSFRQDITVSDYIEYFQFDNIGGTKCSYLFSKYSDIDELEFDIINHPYQLKSHIAKTMNYRSAESDSTEYIFDTIKENMVLLKHFAPYFKFKVINGVTITIALTGSFSRFSPRKKLIDYVAENYNINPIFVKYSSKCNVLVYEDYYGVQNNGQFIDAGKRAMHVDDFLRTIEHLRKERVESNE